MNIGVDIFYVTKIIWCWNIREYLVICQKTFSLSSVTKLKLKQKQKTKGVGHGIGQNMNLNSHLPSIKVKVCCSGGVGT
jgi:hypothetical protein